MSSTNSSLSTSMVANPPDTGPSDTPVFSCASSCAIQSGRAMSTDDFSCQPAMRGPFCLAGMGSKTGMRPFFESAPSNR